MIVLNLIITGIPSILQIGMRIKLVQMLVLNLIITGIPSIHTWIEPLEQFVLEF